MTEAFNSPFVPAAVDTAGGIAPNLIPTPPAAMPEAPGAGDAMERLSPFKQAQDVDSIIKQLSLDRPLPLYIPNRNKYAEYQFHIVNDTPQEINAATMRGWQRVDIPELTELFEDKISGTDKVGKAMRPVLMARHKDIGAHELRMKRQKLHEQNMGLDPKKRTFNSTSAENVQTGPDASKGAFRGLGLGPIRV